jgi:diguanylate cyclase (GGDEF)-like protein
MRHRRIEDRELSLVLATPTGFMGGDSELHVASPLAATVVTGRRVQQQLTQREEDPAPCVEDLELLVLLEASDGEGVLVAGSSACRVPRGLEEAELRDRVTWGTEALRRERARLAKRQLLPDQLIAYFEALNAAETEDGVLCALAEHALRIVGGHRAEGLARDGERGMLRAPCAPNARHGEHRLCILWDEVFSKPGLLVTLDARAGGRVPAAAPLFENPQTALVAHVPVGDEAVLVLTERRDERIFEPQDWDILRALALQAEMAIRRVRLIESVRGLSLTDPLTGLANRRHMEVVMEHVWAGATRGEALALVALDLDGFKEVNDQSGHAAGDRLLRTVAEALRREARRSDVVVRYGGDEFLVILPGGDGSGAEALVERVRKQLAGRVEVSAGVVTYDGSFDSAEQMIREADRRLYEAKRRRAAHLHPVRTRGASRPSTI